MKKPVICMLGFLVLFYSCGTVSLTGRRQLTAIPSDQMIMLGKDTYQKVLMEESLSNNREYTRMVHEAGTRVTGAVESYMRENGMGHRIGEFEWEFRLIADDVLNAWCLPGGKIAFYEGIMPVCSDENGVAVVMAHEIAHVVARHGNERLSQQLAVQLGGIALSEALEKQKESTRQMAMLAFGIGSQVGLVLPYSRVHEKEADEMGLYFMAMAGYDPSKAPEFWERMKQRQQEPLPEFLSTHPNPDTRIRNINNHLLRAMEYYNNSR